MQSEFYNNLPHHDISLEHQIRLTLYVSGTLLWC